MYVNIDLCIARGVVDSSIFHYIYFFFLPQNACPFEVYEVSSSVNQQLEALKMRYDCSLYCISVESQPLYSIGHTVNYLVFSIHKIGIENRLMQQCDLSPLPTALASKIIDVLICCQWLHDKYVINATVCANEFNQ